MKTFLLAIVGLSFSTTTCLAESKLTLESENEKINYSVGYQIGGDFKRQGVEMDEQAIVKGIRDALSSTQPLMTAEDMKTTLINLKKKILADQQEKRDRQKKQYRDEGQLFLAENAEKSGVKSLPSGLQYKIINTGSGKTPTPDDTVTVHYRGTLIDGTEFDSSLRKNQPASFRVDGVIPGWTEALQLMQEGDKWQLFIPPKLAYGEKGPLADRTLIFEIDLIGVN